MNIVERLKDSLDYEYNLSFSERKQLLEEIDRLNNLNKQLVEECQRLDDEETRLNNIINELEKWLKEKQELTCGCGITQDYLYAYENCLEELKELQESNKG